MLSIGSVSSASAASAYYESERYYTDPDQHRSEWFGKGAKDLKLKGSVNPETFKTILEGKVIGQNQQLGRIVDGKLQHIPAVDLTFSAPKSYSVMAEVTEDNILHRAHQTAVKQTLQHIEKEILETRIYETGGIQKNHSNQKMVAALFRHDTSRNLDPQTHTHAVISNMVKGQDGRWRSFDNKSLYHNKLYMGAIYRSHLAYNLHRLGVDVQATHSDGRFELSNIPKELNELFSSRAKEIKEQVSELGASNPRTIDKIALATRKVKEKNVDHSALIDKWKGQIKELGYSIKHLSLHYSRKFMDPQQSQKLADQAVKFSHSHLTERSAVFSEQDLKINAIGFALGKTQPMNIEKAVTKAIKNGELIKRHSEHRHKSLYTTPEMIKLEKSILSEHKAGLRATDQILPSYIVNKHLDKSILNEGQRKAVLLSLTSVNRFVAIQGNAGTGKTTLLKEIKILAQTSGKEIHNLAPSGSAAQTLAQETGSPSETLSAFLHKYDGVIHGRLTDKGRMTLQAEFKNKIILLDESSFASSKQMHGLLKISNELKVPRVILAGDFRQLESVDSGIPFHLLQKNGMRTAKVNEIIRQKNLDLKQAVENTVARDIEAAFKNIGKSIFEHQDQELAEVAAKKWLNLPKSTQDKTAIIAPTHILVDKINKIIHQDLKDQSHLGKKSFTTEILKSTQLTEKQKKHAQYYQAGQKVLFQYDYKSLNIRKGDLLKIKKIDHKNSAVILEGKSGNINWIPSKVAGNRKGGIQVFDSKIISLNEGEKIRWTKNNKPQNIHNNETAKILKITDKNILIKSEAGNITNFREDHPQLKHMNYAYASTTHAAQGKTVSNLIAVMESGRPALTNQKSFYVTISRPKYNVDLITDNTQKLQDTIKQHTGESITALTPEKNMPLEPKQERTSIPTQETEQEPERELAPQRELEKYQDREISL